MAKPLTERNAALLTVLLGSVLLVGCSDLREFVSGQQDHAGEDVHGSAMANDDNHADHNGVSHPDADDETHGAAGNSHEAHEGEQSDEAHEEHAEPGRVHIPEARLASMDLVLTPVRQGSVQSVLALPAEVMLDPDNEAHLVPRVPGIVREVYASIGDQVGQGDLLAVLDSRELASAKSEYLAARAKRELAQQTYVRERDLWQQKISPEQDYLEAKQAFEEAQILVDSAEQQLHALGISQDEVKALPAAEDASLTRYEIRAPFDATVVQRHVTVGETLQESDEIFYVAKLDPVWVMGRVPERDIHRVQLGQNVVVRLDAFEGDEFEGAIDYIGNVLDPESRTVDVRAVLPNPSRGLRQGMFGTMLVFMDTHEHADAFLVPNEALQRTDSGAVVYKRIADGEFEAVPVDVLHASDKLTEVHGSLSENDMVAAGDIFLLKSEAGKEGMGGGHSH